MRQWPASKVERAYAARIELGRRLKRRSGSRRTLSRNHSPDFVFAFHDGVDVGPRMLVHIAEHARLQRSGPRGFGTACAQPVLVLVSACTLQGATHERDWSE